MTRLLRVCVFAGAALVGAALAREAQPDPFELRVALRTRIPPDGAADVLNGTTVGVVRLSPAPATIVSRPAGHLLVPFRAALARTARPATSPLVRLPLPEPSPGELDDMPFDVVFFKDLNGDSVWQGGEPYATAWGGGRGSYRVIVEASPDGRPRWRLLEGGNPPTVRPSTSGVVVYIDPIRPSVDR